MRKGFYLGFRSKPKVDTVVVAEGAALLRQGQFLGFEESHPGTQAHEIIESRGGAGNQ